MSGQAIVNYGAYEVEAADAEHEDLSRGGGNFMKLDTGRNVVRFLPPPAGRNTPFVTVFQHFLNLPGFAEPIIFNCPRLMARKGCPACQKGEKLKSTGNQKDADAARDFWASRRVFANVIDRNDEDAGPKILGFGKLIHEALVAIRRDEDAGGDFTDPVDGFDIVIERTGTTKTDTRYTVRPARKSSELGNLEWIETQPDLRYLAKVPTLEEIKAMVSPQDDPAPSKPTAQDDLNVVADVEPLSDDDIPF